MTQCPLKLVSSGIESGRLQQPFSSSTLRVGRLVNRCQKGVKTSLAHTTSSRPSNVLAVVRYSLRYAALSSIACFA